MHTGSRGKALFDLTKLGPQEFLISQVSPMLRVQQLANFHSSVPTGCWPQLRASAPGLCSWSAGILGFSVMGVPVYPVSSLSDIPTKRC